MRFFLQRKRQNNEMAVTHHLDPGHTGTDDIFKQPTVVLDIADGDAVHAGDEIARAKANTSGHGRRFVANADSRSASRRHPIDRAARVGSPQFVVRASPIRSSIGIDVGGGAPAAAPRIAVALKAKGATLGKSRICSRPLIRITTCRASTRTSVDPPGREVAGQIA